MLQEIVFQVKDIIVQKHIFTLTNEPYWLIKKGDDEFTTWDKPVLNYESLRKMIVEYREDKEREMADEAENDDDFRQEFEENVNLFGMGEFE